MTVGEPDLIVVGAVAGGGVDEARAGVLGDVVARQHRHGEAIVGVERGQRVLQLHAFAIDGFDAPPVAILAASRTSSASFSATISRSPGLAQGSNGRSVSIASTS